MQRRKSFAHFSSSSRRALALFVGSSFALVACAPADGDPIDDMTNGSDSDSGTGSQTGSTSNTDSTATTSETETTTATDGSDSTTSTDTTDTTGTTTSSTTGTTDTTGTTGTETGDFLPIFPEGDAVIRINFDSPDRDACGGELRDRLGLWMKVKRTGTQLEMAGAFGSYSSSVSRAIGTSVNGTLGSADAQLPEFTVGAQVGNSESFYLQSWTIKSLTFDSPVGQTMRATGRVTLDAIWQDDIAEICEVDLVGLAQLDTVRPTLAATSTLLSPFDPLVVAGSEWMLVGAATAIATQDKEARDSSVAFDGLDFSSSMRTTVTPAVPWTPNVKVSLALAGYTDLAGNLARTDGLSVDVLDQPTTTDLSFEDESLATWRLFDEESCTVATTHSPAMGDAISPTDGMHLLSCPHNTRLMGYLTIPEAKKSLAIDIANPDKVDELKNIKMDLIADDGTRTSADASALVPAQDASFATLTMPLPEGLTSAWIELNFEAGPACPGECADFGSFALDNIRFLDE